MVDYSLNSSNKVGAWLNELVHEYAESEDLAKRDSKAALFFLNSTRPVSSFELIEENDPKIDAWDAKGDLEASISEIVALERELAVESKRRIDFEKKAQLVSSTREIVRLEEELTLERERRRCSSLEYSNGTQYLPDYSVSTHRPWSSEEMKGLICIEVDSCSLLFITFAC